MTNALAELAERWRAAWQGPAGGFERCCTPDVGYEDPVSLVPLEGVEALEAYAKKLREAFPDIRVEAAGESLGTDGLACLTWRAGGHRTPPPRRRIGFIGSSSFHGGIRIGCATPRCSSLARGRWGMNC